MDKVSSDQRSRNMAAVKSRNTAPELAVRRVLHGLGLRFRLHSAHLPGTPDIVLARHHAVVLVHGCFWHGHHCPRGRAPASNTAFWAGKLDKNKDRDRADTASLRRLGWRVLVVWECETKDLPRLRNRLAKWLDGPVGAPMSAQTRMTSAAPPFSPPHP